MIRFFLFFIAQNFDIDFTTASRWELKHFFVLRCSLSDIKMIQTIKSNQNSISIHFRLPTKIMVLDGLYLTYTQFPSNLLNQNAR